MLSIPEMWSLGRCCTDVAAQVGVWFKQDFVRKETPVVEFFCLTIMKFTSDLC